MSPGGPKLVQSMQQLPDRYKGVLLDQFGVLHDGVSPYPGAIEAVSQMAARGMKLLVLSNSSRRSGGALRNLERLGFDPGCFAGVITSGEVTHRVMLTRPPAWRRCLHLTWGSRGAISLEGLGLETTTDPQQADFILAHGTEALGTSTDGSSAEPCTLEHMQELLRQCAGRGGLPMVVANPDIVTVAGSELRVMPGTLARHYASLGGEVRLMGKPDAIIYTEALQMLGLLPQDVVAIGDSIEHDICGAGEAGVHSVFVMGGIHKEDVQLAPQQAGAGAGSYSFSRQQLAELCRSNRGANPQYLLPFFCW